MGKRFFIEPLIGFGKGKYFPKIFDVRVVSFYSGNLLPTMGLCLRVLLCKIFPLLITITKHIVLCPHANFNLFVVC